MRILVPGISGKLGRVVALRLLAEGHEITGIDRRPWTDAPPGITVFAADIRKRAAEEVFRKFRPQTVVHMATVTHLLARSEDRYRINLGGTRAVLAHCQTYGAEHFVFVGRHTYYGAAPDSPLYHTEDEPPLGLGRFPELADLVAADLYAGTALWRRPEFRTSILRASYTLGETGQGTLGSFLRGARVPTLLGFDPLFQVLHESDFAEAIAATVRARPHGVFNVAARSPMPLSTVIKEAGRTSIPVPEPFIAAALGRFGLPKLPQGALDHIKYPIVIDDRSFRKETGFSPKQGDLSPMHAFRAAHPAHPAVPPPI